MFYWNKDLALPMRIIMFLIMTPVEIAPSSPSRSRWRSVSLRT